MVLTDKSGNIFFFFVSKSHEKTKTNSELVLLVIPATPLFQTPQMFSKNDLKDINKPQCCTELHVIPSTAKNSSQQINYLLLF